VAGAVARGVEPNEGTELGLGAGFGLEDVVGVGEDCAPPVAPTLPGAVPLCVGVGVVDGVAVVL
jgi:hypothetical protein